MSETPSEDWE